MKVLKTIIEYSLIILLVILLRIFIITPVQVDGGSMMDTLHNNDIMILNIIGYRLGDVKRFDIIVFEYNDESLIKRVIGLPGEYIEYKDNQLYINNNLVEEVFLDDYTPDFKLLDTGYERIPPNKYFVVGDNRDNSTDSRYIGFIDRDQIMGKSNIIIYPFKRLGKVR